MHAVNFKQRKTEGISTMKNPDTGNIGHTRYSKKTNKQKTTNKQTKRNTKQKQKRKENKCYTQRRKLKL